MVPVDNVYRTVLNILNKENRGYVTPAEFNTLAKQAQTEIFEHYFTVQYRASQGPMSDGDYSDVVRNIEEKITFFDNVSDEIPTVGATGTLYAYPTDFYRLGIVTANAIHADEVSHKDITYINLSRLTAPTNTQPVYTRHEGGVTMYPNRLPVQRTLRDDLTVTSGNMTLSIPVIPNNTLTSIDGLTVRGITVPFTQNGQDITFNLSSTSLSVMSSHTYVISYTTSSPVRMVYVREPAIPQWVGATTGGQLIANTTATDYQDFELHPSEEPELVAKILAYSGVIIRAADIVQVGSAKEQQIEQNNG